MTDETYLQQLENEIILAKKSRTYLEACIGYAKRLLENSLPVIFDNEHLALLIGMKTRDLTFFLIPDSSCFYKTIKIPKQSGGLRKISIPVFDLKYIQRWILDVILSKMVPSIHAIGFRPGLSIVDNAKIHLDAEEVVCLDIEDFFPSISFSQVFRLFNYYGYTKQVSYTLAKLCTYDNSLPQGSPASPMISNIVCLRLDKRLSALAERFLGNYSRYADDITFSGPLNINKIIPFAINIINDEGFKVNAKKTRVAGRNQRQEITGLIINSGKISVPRSFRRKLQQEIYYCKKYGVLSHMKHVGQFKRFYREHLYGKAYYIKMVNPEQGSKFLKELDNLEWEGYL